MLLRLPLSRGSMAQRASGLFLERKTQRETERERERERERVGCLGACYVATSYFVQLCLEVLLDMFLGLGPNTATQGEISKTANTSTASTDLPDGEGGFYTPP